MRMVIICHIFQLKEVYPITKNSNIVEVLMIPDFFDVEIKLKALLIFSSFLPGCFALSSLAVDFIHRFLQYGLHYGIAGNYIYTFTSHETNVNNIVYPPSKNLSIAAFPVYPNMPSLSLIYIYLFLFLPIRYTTVQWYAGHTTPEAKDSSPSKCAEMLAPCNGRTCCDNHYGIF